MGGSVARIGGNETHGNCSCNVSNKVGEGDPCTITIPAKFVEKLKQENQIILMLSIVGTLVGVVLLGGIVAWCYNCQRKRAIQGDPIERDSPPLMSSILITEPKHGKLPFKNLKKPPKEALLQNTDDDMEYADAQFKKGFGLVNFFKDKENNQKIAKDEKELKILKELSKI